VADGNRTMRGRILIVDDDTALSEMLSIVLRNEGYDTYLCATGDKAVPAFREFKPDLLLLDLMLPGMDGIDVCRAIRAESGVPIVMLTAKSDTVDVVLGLESGADDYVVKPFAMAELVARTKALLRRPGGALGVTLRAGNVVLDTVGRDVRVGGVPLQLPRRECAVLEHLLRRQGRVVPKSVLEEKLYGIDDELESNAVPVHVHHLRRKLQDASATAEIHTVRGVGYLLTGAE